MKIKLGPPKNLRPQPVNSEPSLTIFAALYFCYKCELSNTSVLGILDHCLESHVDDEKFCGQKFMLYHGIYHLSETTVKPQERKVLKFDVDLNTIQYSPLQEKRI